MAASQELFFSGDGNTTVKSVKPDLKAVKAFLINVSLKSKNVIIFEKRVKIVF